MGSVSAIAMSSPRAYHEIEQFRKPVVDARDDDGEDQNDHKHHARGFERLAERGPRDAFKLGESLLDLAPLPDKPVGLFVFILLDLLAGRIVLLRFGRLSVSCRSFSFFDMMISP